jgi:hypothetical protein
MVASWVSVKPSMCRMINPTLARNANQFNFDPCHANVEPASSSALTVTASARPILKSDSRNGIDGSWLIAEPKRKNISAIRHQIAVHWRRWFVRKMI